MMETKKQKRVLIFSGGHGEERLIVALKELGCYVITTGNRPDHPWHKLADEYVYGDYSDTALMYDIAVRKNVDAVCPCTGDCSAIAAAYIAEKLGLPGHDSYETTVLLHNKDKFKAFAVELGGIRTPVSVPFSDVETALKWAEETTHEYPLIVKPVDREAGTGVSRVDSLVKLKEQIKIAFQESRSKRVLVEPFIEGSQHGFCTFLVDQKVVAVSTNNEYAIINPYQVEIDTFPADHVEIVKADLIGQIERIAKALNLSDGIFHLQYILQDGKPYIIECMRRTPGNVYCMLAEMADGGLRWEYWQARAKCGFGCEGLPTEKTKTGFAAYRKLMPSRNGVYEGWELPEDIKKHVFHECVMREPGEEITNYMKQTVGLVFLEFSSRGEMMEIMIDRAAEFKVLVR